MQFPFGLFQNWASEDSPHRKEEGHTELCKVTEALGWEDVCAANSQLPSLHWPSAAPPTPHSTTYQGPNSTC